MLTTKIKYLVIPGFVQSINDNQIHFISAEKLIDLYGIDKNECVIKYGDYRDYGKDFRNLIRLYPVRNGNYDIPKS